ncbi:hypothetical protein DE146DRAFT_445109 [Phaeosphaeria sp. MPI-PUGE-AT-0046c]|nr:hypothetical protein DE146DRAFT_445109 [Phaeosphaeria sp. MPI-PUGE-AT-0046c]
MVFRGRLSKACQRCRDRRLKCDLQKPTCSSCCRAQEACQGYRDTNTLRIDDQTDFTRTRVLGQKNLIKPRNAPVPIKLHHLPQDLQIIGRQMFFAYYVSDFSHTWDFLFQYAKSGVAPEYLSLGIDAVSLAFLSHQVASPTAKRMGTRKYVEALRKVNKAIQDPDTAAKMSTFETALLLDLFEKMMISVSERNAARHAHVEGALALVKLRGINSFRKGPELRALLGLSLNATICSLSTGIPIPKEVREIRKHAAQFVDTTYPKWRLSDCILDVTDLPHDQTLSPAARIARNAALDRRLEIIGEEAGPAWSYERKFVSAHDQRVHVPDGFFPLYDVYQDRTITQMWNVLRVTRIQLCEDIVESGASLDDPNTLAECQRAKQVIVEMIREVCASCPQMTNCCYAARHKLPSGTVPEVQHTHTMSHLLDVYIMIFSLFVVAWARNCPVAARAWAIGQLEHIAEHFGIKEAANVLAILQDQGRRDRVDPWVAGPWVVYKMLGSHAFAAS